MPPPRPTPTPMQGRIDDDEYVEVRPGTKPDGIYVLAAVDDDDDPEFDPYE